MKDLATSLLSDMLSFGKAADQRCLFGVTARILRWSLEHQMPTGKDCSLEAP